MANSGYWFKTGKSGYNDEHDYNWAEFRSPTLPRLRLTCPCRIRPA